MSFLFHCVGWALVGAALAFGFWGENDTISRAHYHDRKKRKKEHKKGGT